MEVIIAKAGKPKVKLVVSPITFIQVVSGVQFYDVQALMNSRGT